MNKCHFLKDLSAYLDNQLSNERKTELEKHIRECIVCSQELEQLKLVSRKLQNWQAPDLGPEFESTVRNRIVQEELERGGVKMKKKTLAILVPSGVLAGILVMVFFVVTMNSYTKRGINGRLREDAESLGDQYASAKHISRSLTGSVATPEEQAAVGFDGKQYEPYYLTSDVPTGSRSGMSLPNKPEVYARAGNEASLWESRGDRYLFGGIGGVSPTRYNTKNKELAMESTLDKSAILQARSPAVDRLEPEAGQGSVIVIQPVLPATGEGEKIIRTAEVSLEVEDGKTAYKQANDICQELGGYLASSNFYKDAEGREAGTLTIRIPKDKFLAALDKLSALGKVENSSTNSQDVSQEYANLKSQLDTSMIVYNKMLEALQKRQVTIPDAMHLESELTPVRAKIEYIKNRIESLNNAVSFTTITVTFHEPTVSLKVLKETRHQIEQSMLNAKINAIKFFANALPSLVIGGICLIFAVVVIALLVSFIVRLLKRG